MLRVLDYLDEGEPLRFEDFSAYAYMNARFALDIAAGCETDEGRDAALEDAARWQQHGAVLSACERGEGGR